MSETAVFVLLIVIVVCMAVLFIMGCDRASSTIRIGRCVDWYHLRVEDQTVITTDTHKVMCVGLHTIKLGSMCYLRECAGPNKPEYTVLLIPDYEQAFMVDSFVVRAEVE